ncbi:MAG: 16S rRNA (cytosine(967)-C(5))-methyltransferase RsmB [Ruminococcaceae bacterium]|nr:16S rRNA (cytosine(967)-C(5))-methyltransferase RsmB [Oscillospiraceae bacterium]
MANARKVAVSALMQIETDSAYSNITLNKVLSKYELSKEDRAFTSALFYGVLDRKITIDYILSKFIKKPLSKITPFTACVLRISVYQIKFMERIPESAAVNEAVKLVKGSKERFNASFVNAVLRNLLRNPVTLPLGEDVKSLSVRYSCPEWIVKSFINDYGIKTAVELLEHSLKAPPVILRVNTSRITSDKLIEKLGEEGITAQKTDISNALSVVGGIDVKGCKCYKDGLFHIQDTASQLSVSALDLKAGERVMDLCSAPGGKSFTMAEIMDNKGEILSFDLYESRVELIKNGAKRLGLSCIKAHTQDATVFNEELGLFDAVLCDVPCSGFGVLRRKPEIKYKPCEDLSELEEIQKKILENADRYLKSGGRILYSTCTLRHAENEMQVKAFLDKNADYELQYEHTYMPHTDNSDGFYCALFKKG